MLTDGQTNKNHRMALYGSASIAALLFLLVNAYFLIPNPYPIRNQFDFGTVPQGTVVRREVRLINFYPWSVEVTGMLGGCGCEKPFRKDPPFTLPAFSFLTGVATLDTAELRGAIKERYIVTTRTNPSGSTIVMKGRVE